MADKIDQSRGSPYRGDATMPRWSPGSQTEGGRLAFPERGSKNGQNFAGTDTETDGRIGRPKVSYPDELKKTAGAKNGIGTCWVATHSSARPSRHTLLG
jgi:hypothetical protein